MGTAGLEGNAKMKLTVALISSLIAALALIGCGSSGPALYDTVTTASGLKYRDVFVGAGRTPFTDDDVTIHYEGRLENGVLFANTRGGDPYKFTFGKGGVIAGLEEGLRTMRVGGTRRLIIPPHLGYGDEGNSQYGIPANATLIYDVELVDVATMNWVTTPSGLMYADVNVAYGPTPEPGQRCFVHYTGWLQDGTQFDTSRDNYLSEPFSFILGQGQVIAGWDEGVATMTVGSTRRLVIPPGLAYGASGSPPNIPPNATLTFEVELLDIENPF